MRECPCRAIQQLLKWEAREATTSPCWIDHPAMFHMGALLLLRPLPSVFTNYLPTYIQLFPYITSLGWMEALSRYRHQTEQNEWAWQAWKNPLTLYLTLCMFILTTPHVTPYNVSSEWSLNNHLLGESSEKYNYYDSGRAQILLMNSDSIIVYAREDIIAMLGGKTFFRSLTCLNLKFTYSINPPYPSTYSFNQEYRIGTSLWTRYTPYAYLPYTFTNYPSALPTRVIPHPTYWLMPFLALLH